MTLHTMEDRFIEQHEEVTVLFTAHFGTNTTMEGRCSFTIEDDDGML